MKLIKYNKMNVIQVGDVECSVSSNGVIKCVCEERNLYSAKKMNKTVIMKLFYDHFKQIFPNNFITFIDYYTDGDSIYIDLNTRFISLYYKRRYININYDYIIKNSEFSDEIIKNILFGSYICCNNCNKKMAEGTCYLNNNKTIICNDCYCLCNSPTSIKYKLKGKNICFHCLEKILNNVDIIQI